MAKILFIESDLRNEKLGIMYLSAALKEAGHETMLCWLEREKVHEVIETFVPDFLAFSLVTGTHGRLLSLAAELRSRYGVPVIAGGPHATFFPEQIPAESAEFVVVGQGEKAVVDIVEGRIAAGRVSYPLQDLDALPFPDRTLFYRYPEFRDNPMKNVITCRDCPYSCSYCYNHTWKEKYRGEQHFLQRRSVDGVLAELKQIRERYPVEQFLFIDDNFLYHREWVKEFCVRYPAEIGIPFLCSFSLNLFDEEILTMLREAGLFMVNFALESADPRVQREVLNRGHVKNEQIEKGVELLRGFGIKTRMQNMIGLPVADSLADALNTLAFNRRNRVDDSWVSIFQPYPNTRLAAYCSENGYSDKAPTCAESFFDRSCLAIDHADEIRRLQKWWYFLIRYEIDDDCVEKLLKIDFEEETGDRLQKLRYEFSRSYLYGMKDDNPALQHDWAAIRSDFGDRASFPALEPLIRRFSLPYGLADIITALHLPENVFFQGVQQ